MQGRYCKEGIAYGVAIGIDANGLVVDEALVFAAVLVDEVHRVAGELHAAGLLALAEVGVVLACTSPHSRLACVLNGCGMRCVQSVLVMSYVRTPRGCRS